MNYKEKADAFAAYLTETENGFDREDVEGGVLYTFVSGEGMHLGVTFTESGDVRGAVMLFGPGAIPPGRDEFFNSLFNELNSQLVLAKCYRDDAGVVWLTAPYFETGGFIAAQLFQLLLMVGKQAGSLSEALEQILRVAGMGGHIDA